MTSATDLVRLVRDLVPPVGATQAVATVEVEPCGRLANGSSSGRTTDGRVPRTQFGVAWLIGGRTRTAPIALFDRPTDAFRLMDLIAGIEPTSRSGADLVPDAGVAVVERGRPRATTPERCLSCGGPLPAKERGRPRLTCSDRCRTAVARGRVAADADPTPDDATSHFVTGPGLPDDAPLTLFGGHA